MSHKVTIHDLIEYRKILKKNEEGINNFTLSSASHFLLFDVFYTFLTSIELLPN